MADAISVTGLILTVLDSIGSVSTIIDKIQGAPQLVVSLRSDLDALKPSLNQLGAIIRQVEPEHGAACIRNNHSPALQQLENAADNFATSLHRWTSHSADGKLAWRDGLDIATRHQSQVQTFQQHLAATKQSLTLSITVTSLQITTLNRDADYSNQVDVLRTDSIEATRQFTIELSRISEQIRDLTVSQSGDHRSQSDDDSDSALRQLQHYKSATESFQNLCSESIPNAVSGMRTQRISHVVISEDSTAHVGSFNELAGAQQVDQDISSISTRGKSFAIIGRANNIDFNLMFTKRYT
ncbi:uncharacterized protein PG986_010119 [Apiospora aurea]|uniref:Azaphilone pigments biosynthesis cluster protein L N-terminal domain-containing protein n=1 Tax=Apiospora aurea TaxID=335848 RepID=A0ABR1Q9K8_9PEZI